MRHKFALAHMPLIIVTALVLLVPRIETMAAEAGASHYLPGTAGDLGLAFVPDPGTYVSNTVFAQFGNLGTAVLGGEIDIDIGIDLVLDMVGAAHTFETTFLGGRYTIAAVLPFGYANVKAELTLPGGGTLGDNDDSFALSDVAIIPLQLNWAFGQFSFKFAEIVLAPTGSFTLGDAANLGRNYWSFDTVGAMTWFNAATATEISVAPGYMVNTKNNATDYKTGGEFHVDFVINQFLSETFAIGFRGYYYQQVTGDSGDGALLGDFKSSSTAVGAGFFWMPPFAAGRLVVQGKWMHDVHHKNRFDSDYATLGVSWKF